MSKFSRIKPAVSTEANEVVSDSNENNPLTSKISRIRPAVSTEANEVVSKSNENNHVKPFDLKIPVAGVSENLSELKDFVDNSLKQMLDERKHQPSDQRVVLNRNFNFESTSVKIQEQAIATLSHVSSHLANKKWYEESLDYLSHNHDSFGRPSTGATEYYKALLFLLKDVPYDEKFDKLKQHIITRLEISYQTESEILAELTDLFDSWWNAIPFDLECFKSLQDQYDATKLLVLVVGPLINFKKNRYSGTWEWNDFSISKLDETFRDLTKIVMKEAMLLTLPDSQELTGTDKIEFGLRLAKRKTKIEVGYLKNLDSDDPKFFEIWDEWLADEKAFFDWLTSRTNSQRSKDSLHFTLSPEQLEELKKVLSKYVDDPLRLGSLLDGNSIDGQIVINDSCSQNKFCEIFKRLSYNEFIAEHPSEIIVWLTTHFSRSDKPLNLRTIQDLFQPRGRTPSNRIRDFDWLIFKSKDQLQKEAL